MIARIRPFPAILRLALAGGSIGVAGADGFIPNQVDRHTLHLWHLDEERVPFADSCDPPQPLRGLFNGALAGRSSLPGLGRSISFNARAGGVPGASDLAGAIVTASDRLATGPEDNVDAGFRYFGPDGAFTYEVVLKFDILPRDAGVIACGLISMDGDGGDRVFNFRIEREGFLSFISLPNAGMSGLGLATIPTTGPHAIDTEHWFHAAVSYDGRAGATNNLKLYWTRLGPGLTTANFIGNGTLSGSFSGVTGDLAIGNEARAFQDNAEAEPFPGLLDEVRVSDVARHPSDFFFVAPERRVGPNRSANSDRDQSARPRFDLKLASVLVDASPALLPPGPNPTLRLGSGLHRLDFDFGSEDAGGSVKLRCQLEGIDERWQETKRGMSLICQTLDRENQILSESRFPFIGRSAGWETTLEDSRLTHRAEPVFIPAGTTAIRLSLSSGAPDTTGFVAIDGIALTVPGGAGESLWKDGSLSAGETAMRAAGAPDGWQREGSDPAIARLVIRPGNPALGLVDGDQVNHGGWTSSQSFIPPGTGTYALSWNEAYNVIGGNLHRATYVNVPPGRYVFRAIGLADGGSPLGAGISLPVTIDPPFWQRPWFGPAVAAISVAFAAALIVLRLRRRSKRRLEALRFQNALEQDRTRIARDLHDDLGTRVTVINMTASLAQRVLDSDPAKARRHLDKMADSARDLVVAMDDLVWAVDPAHDTLDHLASHLTRLAEEMFRDSPVRCRLEIPPLLPARPLGAQFRHHVALAVKESLHNVLRHAGPCEVFLTLGFDGRTLEITVRDTGQGFDQAVPSTGHGRDNLPARLREIGGTCTIDSSPGGGTCIVMTCPIPEEPA